MTISVLLLTKTKTTTIKSIFVIDKAEIKYKYNMNIFYKLKLN